MGPIVRLNGWEFKEKADCAAQVFRRGAARMFEKSLGDSSHGRRED